MKHVVYLLVVALLMTSVTAFQPEDYTNEFSDVIEEYIFIIAQEEIKWVYYPFQNEQ